MIGADGITKAAPLVDKGEVLKIVAVATEVVDTLLVTIGTDVCLQTLHTSSI